MAFTEGMSRHLLWKYYLILKGLSLNLWPVFSRDLQLKFHGIYCGNFIVFSMNILWFFKVRMSLNIQREYHRN